MVEKQLGSGNDNVRVCVEVSLLLLHVRIVESNAVHHITAIFRKGFETGVGLHAQLLRRNKDNGLNTICRVTQR